jgi:hypothetical protein
MRAIQEVRGEGMVLSETAPPPASHQGPLLGALASDLCISCERRQGKLWDHGYLVCTTCWNGGAW